MFFDPSQPQRMNAMREMILARDEKARRSALKKLLPYQQGDFEGIFTAMAGLPVTIRLLDPPLHEFLPQRDNEAGVQAVVDELNGAIDEELADASPSEAEVLAARRVTVADIHRRVEQLHESNPMLGHRGCRLSLTYPEILEMQVSAIIGAALRCVDKGIKVLPEIMIPLTIDPKELSLLTERTREVADELIQAHGGKLNYLVGTMIETPRAALLAKSMAQPAEFFSFGTNDLTQLTMGLSRDDAGRFLPDYVDEAKAGVFTDDPFQSLDVAGVGFLVRMGCEQGRIGRANIKLGICGEHGGDPQSIRFCEEVGLAYVSCSPYRVPIARLATAQATIACGGDSTKRGRTSTSKRKPSGGARSAKPRSAATSRRGKGAKSSRPAKRKAGAKKSGGSRSVTRVKSKSRRVVTTSARSILPKRTRRPALVEA